MSTTVLPMIEPDAVTDGSPEPHAIDEVRWKTQYAEIASLAGGLAHEIRNPLSTMRLQLELLDEGLAEDGTPREKRHRQRVAKVLAECEHLERILNDFLQFTRAHAPRREPADLNAEVRAFLELFTPLAAEQQVEVSPHLAAHLPTVRLDRALFRQVLQNLTRNALQAMPAGGRFEVLTHTAEDEVRLELIDTGCGMDAKTQARMFDTFFSTKPGGSGLGLPTVRRIIESHGGTIGCDSAPGAGTRFVLRFPAATHDLA
jgi:signal transduction histidine kinase